MQYINDPGFLSEEIVFLLVIQVQEHSRDELSL